MKEFHRQSEWYKDAVIYEVHVKTYCDATGSGAGDLKGLITKLDYIRDLGVTAIWLLPLYPSPLRDDGYDIADYMSINPTYGTLNDFKELLVEAHQRGLYVITELVLNHTSDQHPWFQKSRRAPPGSPERDFYVWSDTKEKYREARIIFKDFEPSNWSYDAVANSYYWHRFFSHQPDLNYDNPAVHAAMLEVVDFWFELGIDGLRLDAVPYLYEREGTSCENLPETHAYLKKLVAHVNHRFENRMLLAEANQWPEDAVAYFGKGDACQMAFHFPLMPRLYMAVEMADRFPIIDILEQTPAIPDNCQWAIFLRNHDELTLEMVTDEERDYMYRVYARDERARINLGIRRRLAPLMGGNRRKIELMLQMLLSLPGVPVLYYGDEIGMGDNIFLGDRDGVRTPMQWSPDRNAGFSRANAQKLYLPVITDPEYHYETINVENQDHNSSSLLWWMRKRLHLRRSYTALRRGTVRYLPADNTRVLAFLREDGPEAILVVANLSQHAQAARLELSEFAGCEPIELGGNTRFPQVKNDSYLLTLGSYDVYWLRLTQSETLMDTHMLNQVSLGEWNDLSALLHSPSKESFETDILIPYLMSRTWFDGHDRVARSLQILDSRCLGPKLQSALLILNLQFMDGPDERFALVVGFVPEGQESITPITTRIARIVLGALPGWLVEAEQSLAASEEWMDWVLKGSTFQMALGECSVVKDHTMALDIETSDRFLSVSEEDTAVVRLVLNNKCVLRWYRHMQSGKRSDLEMIAVLAGKIQPAITPDCLSRVQYHVSGQEPILLGFVQNYVRAECDGVELATMHANHALERIETQSPEWLQHLVAVPHDEKKDDPLSNEQYEILGGTWAEFISHLGRQLASLHLALSDAQGNPDFMPEPYTMLYQHSTFHSIRTLVRRQFLRMMNQTESGIDTRLPYTADLVLSERRLVDQLKRLIVAPIDIDRIRIHGNLILERLLFTGKDFVFTSFDGEPWRPFPERRFKFCALRDIAALQHSLEIVGNLAEEAYNDVSKGRMLYHEGMGWGHHWAEWSGKLLLSAYLHGAGNARFLPKNKQHTEDLLRAFRIERAAYEIKAYHESQPKRAKIANDALFRWAREG